MQGFLFELFFRNSFWAEFQDCLMAEFIVVNDSLA